MLSAPIAGGVTTKRHRSPMSSVALSSLLASRSNREVSTGWLGADVRRVLRGRDQSVACGWVRGLDAQHPPVTIGVGIHERRLLVQTLVDRDDLTGDRTE